MEHKRFILGWKSDRNGPGSIGPLLKQRFGDHAAALWYPDPLAPAEQKDKNRWWIVRFLDNGEGAFIMGEDGVAHPNPRPWSRPLEIVGSAETIDELCFILADRTPRIMVGAGLRPRRNAGGDWTGLYLPVPGQLAPAAVIDSRSRTN
jgi:hypothetical protein